MALAECGKTVPSEGRSSSPERGRVGRRLIDLSMPITEHPLDYSVEQVVRWRHEDGSRRIARKAVLSRKIPLPVKARRAWGYLTGGRRLSAECFPDGLFLGNEIVTLSVHAGTHMDAPYHYGPLSEGRPAKRITDIPLDWCHGDGVVLRFRDKEPRGIITAYDVEMELERIDYELKPFDIVLIDTGSHRLWPKPQYFAAHPGMSREATEYLVDRGVKVIGVDMNNFDLPPVHMIDGYFRTGDPGGLWPCHLYGREREYLQIERLANLDRIPVPHGFTVLCAPVQVAGAGAGGAAGGHRGQHLRAGRDRTLRLRG
jgi:kynurenine formamidase